MLSEISDLTWECSDLDLGRGFFPPQLTQCAEIQDLSVRPLLIRVGLIYRSIGVILLDTPLRWDREQRAIVLTKKEKIELQRRLRLSQIAEREPIRNVKRGIAEALSRPLYADDVAALMGANPLSVPSARAWVFKPHTNAIDVEPRPDAIAFHSIAMPKTMTLKIEPTTRCNFECGFCYGRHLQQGDLGLQAFESVLERFADIRAIELTGEGEPLLNKDIYKFIALSSQRGMITHITTNGSALNDQNIERLLDAGLSSIAVSMESLDPKRFARFRPGGELNKVKNGIKRVVAAARARKANLTVSLWTTLMRDTVHEVPAFRRFAEDVGVDFFECFQTLNPIPAYQQFYDDFLKDNILEQWEIAEMIASPKTDPEVRAALESASAVYDQSSCGIFMDTVMVNWRGEITPCCLLKVPDFPSFGNLRQISLESIWSEPEFEMFRFALLHGIVLQPCMGCPDVASARKDWNPGPC